ncbi:MAG: ATP-dependent Clp protease adaptor ClpS [Nitrospiria bacterium]
MKPGVLDRPESAVLNEDETEEAKPWQVTIFDDDVHTIDEVIFQVQKATGVSLEVAFEVTMEVHTQGQSICYAGILEKCEQVASILREISLSVEVAPAEA